MGILARTKALQAQTEAAHVRALGLAPPTDSPPPPRPSAIVQPTPQKSPLVFKMWKNPAVEASTSQSPASPATSAPVHQAPMTIFVDLPTDGPESTPGQGGKTARKKNVQTTPKRPRAKPTSKIPPAQVPSDLKQDIGRSSSKRGPEDERESTKEVTVPSIRLNECGPFLIGSSTRSGQRRLRPLAFRSTLPSPFWTNQHRSSPL